MYSTAAGRHVGHVIFHYTASTCCVHAQALYIKHHINMPCIDYVFSHFRDLARKKADSPLNSPK